MQKNTRVGAKRRAEIPPTVIQGLNAGTLESCNLVEALAVDFALLMQQHFPEIDKKMLQPLENVQPLGITKRMSFAGQILLEHYSLSLLPRLVEHPSDTIRGWACFMIGSTPNLSFPQRLKLIQPFADDPHSGVREWAWMALRRFVIEDVQNAIESLQPWVQQHSEYLRRFAIEISRPRGVWCSHIETLKHTPELGLSLLNSLISDPSHYVQNAVSNWLNDAAKSQPNWVQAHCALWQKQSNTKETAKICKRALRSFSK